MITVLVVALGAAVGAPARFALERRFIAPVFPRGLLVVNVLGSFVAGVVLVATSGWVQDLLLIGFCGALTTYSGFAWQAANMWREHRRTFWVAISAMTVGCAAAFVVGYEITSRSVG